MRQRRSTDGAKLRSLAAEPSPIPSAVDSRVGGGDERSTGPAGILTLPGHHSLVDTVHAASTGSPVATPDSLESAKPTRSPALGQNITTPCVQPHCMQVARRCCESSSMSGGPSTAVGPRLDDAA